MLTSELVVVKNGARLNICQVNRRVMFRLREWYSRVEHKLFSYTASKTIGTLSRLESDDWAKMRYSIIKKTTGKLGQVLKI